MDNTPLVSVIIPSYNHAQYIGTAIQSVLDQTYPNIELIIVDDASRDGSAKVIAQYQSDPRVQAIFLTENRGQSFALTQALGLARGSYVSVLPSDDWYLPEKTALQVAALEASSPQVGVAYGAGQRYFEDTGETQAMILPVHTGWIARKLIVEGNFIYPVTPLFRRAVLDTVPLNAGFKAEGEAAYIRFALKFQFTYVDSVVGVMRDHSYNIGKDAEVMYAEITRYWDWFFALPDLPPDIRALEPVAREKLNRTKGMQLIADKRRFAKGRRCLLRAMRYQPRLAFQPKVMGALALSCLPRPAANAVLDRMRAP